MSPVAVQQAVRVFRPHMALRVVLVMALGLWMVAAALTVGYRHLLEPAVMVGALAFCGLFTLLLGHYLPQEISVDDQAVTYRGFFAARRLAFSEIRTVDVLPVPMMMVNYGIHTARNTIAFTSFIAGHRDLLELVVERAHLVPRRD